ncbi:MAG: tyrosine--tRNA ligase [Thermoanaerobaculia bacterium]|nr:tyrosine--tRNA ligase [Thermoanaerobaculia bacterium]
MSNVFDEFQWRGLVYAATEGLQELLQHEKLKVYIGFDPTASSLHVGSLLQVILLARMQRFGHTPIALVGGGTGMIGDPSGKSQERQLQTSEQVAINVAGIREQLARFLDFGAGSNAAQLVDNRDWLAPMSLIDFLRDIGKHFTVNYMQAKESVKRRLEGDEGISFTEFSYMLLQAYDFLELYERHGCRLQMGGSDQWGNITAGTELIRKVRGGRAHGLVVPLVTTASGVKFGKTEAGTIWLDAERTSPYRFFQFWLNTTDQDVVGYLKSFTWLGQGDVAELESAVAEHPERREAQKRLAREMTTLVHGETACARAVRSSEILFGAEIAGLSAAEILEVFGEAPSSQIERSRLQDGGVALVELLAESGLVPSKGAARRLVREGGAYVNNQRMNDEGRRIGLEDLFDGTALLLRKGQKQYHLITLRRDS